MTTFGLFFTKLFHLQAEYSAESIVCTKAGAILIPFGTHRFPCFTLGAQCEIAVYVDSIRTL